MSTAEFAATTARPQHLDALARANDVRLRQADLKRRIADGTLPIDVALSPHAPLDDADFEALERMVCIDVLCAVRRCGGVVARKILAGDHSTPPIPERKRIGRLTPRQKATLVDAARVRLPWACAAPARTLVDAGRGSWA